MSIKYIEKDGIPIPVNDVLAWARWFEDTDRTVLKTDIGDIQVSTVFLGIDHSFGGGNPLLYETMIFGGDHNNYTDRYETRDEAKQGHKKAVELVNNGK